MPPEPYNVVLVPDPVLKTKSSAVERVDNDVRAQMDRMLATMHTARGIGLAANQVGLLNRVLVMDMLGAKWHLEDEGGIFRVARVESEFPEEVRPDPIVMANPEVIWESEKKSVYNEGCLSIPGHWADIVRPAEVRVRYLDYQGREQELSADGLLSHCVQHEIDHLNGVLFVDYLSKLKRDMIIRKVQKARRDGDEEL